MSPQPPRALLFDVFGTCVDWRTTVTNALIKESKTPSSDVPDGTRKRLSSMTSEDWGAFAQEWRNTYMHFVQSIARDSSIPWKSVDQHHYDALGELLEKWSITGLWNDEERLSMSLIWHKLDPWDDSVEGMKLLNTKFTTCTLSNGNISLLEDLREHSNIQFKELFSGELFNSYKPSPKVYLGAVDRLGMKPEECAMVAAHLKDLEAAKSCGLQTIYVERPQEEGLSPDVAEDYKTNGLVDLWVPGDENGFIAVAEKLGVSH
ncbi:haloacid dehalogenase [Microthyrium microscopicum]|uniref:Haloacid dehalogenase n=1 Tax=Microthyrium microscopicum TaxID=703497 RepID=A0A6A6U131_9PEZI|nr:haloacid dehalogenase [Microthyrium microscopicum]